MARHGVSDVLDFFSRFRECRLRTFLLFTKGKAREILEVSSKIESSPVEEISKKEEFNLSPKVTLRDFVNMLNEQGTQPIAPGVEISKLGIKSNESTWINGTAVFNKDKLIGWLDDKQTRGFLWFRNEVRTGTIDINIPKEDGGGKMCGNILNAQIKLTPKLNNNKIRIEIDIQSEIAIVENTSKLDLTKSEIIQKLEKVFEYEITFRAQNFVYGAKKELECDIFGFGKIVYETYPKIWNSYYKNKWDNEFKKIPVVVNTTVKIPRTGFFSKSIMQPDK